MLWWQRHPVEQGGDPDAVLLRFSPRFACDCPRLLKVLVTGLAVGLLTGFLGVGGGFLVVPALVLALTLPIKEAIDTSLWVTAINSAAAFTTRMVHGVGIDWPVVVLLTGVAMMGSLAGALCPEASTNAGSGWRSASC